MIFDDYFILFYHTSLHELSTILILIFQKYLYTLFQESKRDKTTAYKITPTVD